MEDFPNNSHRGKQPDEGRKPEPDKGIKTILTGPVIRRKATLRDKVAHAFFGGKTKQEFAHDLVFELLIPAMSDMMTEVMHKTVEEAFGKNGRRTSVQTGWANRNRHVDYGGRYVSPVRRPMEEPRHLDRRSREMFDFEQIILQSKTEGNAVIVHMYELLEEYEVVSVTDLYKILGITGEYTDRDWGWYDLRGSDVVRTRDGYKLSLPRPIPLREGRA